MDKAIGIQKVLTVPENPRKRVLYFVKDERSNLNIVLPDETGERPGVFIRNVQLTGPKEVLVTDLYGEGIAEYTIINYDSFTDYVVSVSSGSVARNGDKITVVAGESTGPMYLTVNGEHSRIDVVDRFDYPVEIVSKFSSEGEMVPFAIELSPFLSPKTLDALVRVDIQIAEDGEFTVGLKSYQRSLYENSVVVNDTGLATGLKYLRLRYVGLAHGEGRWSSTESFTVIPRPAVVEQAKLLASDGAAGDNFGLHVSFSDDGNTLITGAYFADAVGVDSGSAYIFVRSGATWAQQAKLTPSDGAAYDSFGRIVALSGDGLTALVSAHCDDDKGTDSGSAYVFTRSGSTWTQQAKLVASDGKAGNYFSHSLFLSTNGNIAFIGSHFDDDKGTDAGAVYVFTRSGSTWSQQAKLKASDGAAGDNFGRSVSLSSNGQTALISSHGDDGQGAAYVFVLTGGTWTQQAKLVASDIEAGDYFSFGLSLSGDGNVALLGSHGDDDKGSQSGSAYVFTRTGTTWSQQTKLVPNDGVANGQFGFSLCLSGDGQMAVVGARRDDDKGAGSGSTYVFAYLSGTWTQITKLTASDGAPGDNFGVVVALPRNISLIAVGSHLDDDKGKDSGSVYIFS